jgi:hypothetical protein
MITADGARALEARGGNVAAARRQRRVFARRHPDWSEQRDHVAGALGVARVEAWLAHGWVRRAEPTRALTLTPQGIAQLPA